jgi:UDP-N-acetylenolpyruvoylglucosamine reductase
MLWVRFKRVVGLGVVVWVEIRAGRPVTALNAAAQEACVSGLINYFGIPSTDPLPNVVQF